MANKLSKILEFNGPSRSKATWHSFLEVKAEKEHGHVNALKFKGVLLLLDEPSQKPPNGARGHRILIPTDVAEKNLKTLIGMGVDYEDSFDKHNPKKKVGVIQKAWIDGKKLMCSGIIWKKDFPDVEDALEDKQLGMSFEGSNITMEDPKADIWKITDVCFTGAAILYKTAAAYQKTEALAAAADCRSICAELVYNHSGGKAMSKAEKVQQRGHRNVSAAGEQDVSKTIVKALQNALKPLTAAVTAQTHAIAAMSASIESFQDDQVELSAGPGMLGKKGKKGKSGSSSSSSTSSSSSMPSSSEEASAASSASAAASSASASSASSASSKGKKVKAARGRKGKGSSQSASSASSAASSAAAGASSAASDGSSLSDMSSSNDSASESPGHLNKDANSNKGRKTTVSTHDDKHPTAKLGAKASSRVRKIVYAQKQIIDAKDNRIAKLERKVSSLRAQAKKAYEETERRSVSAGTATEISPMLSGLLAKGSYDIGTLSASQEKVSVSEFDALLDTVPSLDSKERMALKAEAARMGVMDEGRVTK